MQNEREFISEVKQAFRFFGAFSHKIADMPHTNKSGTRFDLKKPFDLFGCYHGVPFAIEFKYMNGLQAFGMRHLRDNQVSGLDAFHRAGGAAYVFLNVRQDELRYHGRSFMHRLYIFEWSEFKATGGVNKAQLAIRPRITYARYPSGHYFALESFFLDLTLRPQYEGPFLWGRKKT